MIGTDARRTDSVEATERLGEALAPALRVGDVVVLQGDLGAGKTRFVSGLARGLTPGARVRSPSFTLVNEYRGPASRLTLYHLDLYRLGTVEESRIEAAIPQLVRLTPKGIRTHLGLNKPIYKQTAAYGHFGRTATGVTKSSW